MQRKTKLHIAKALFPQMGFIIQDKKMALWGFVVVLLFLGISGWLPDGVENLLFENNKLKGILLVGISLAILGVFFEEIFDKLKQDGIKNKDVILDITGGQKIASTAAAFMTLLYPDREFEYVSTSNYQIKAFDIEIVKNDS
ncbi:hypothetical protein [Hippea jasoniae]|uniref:hypothetical protein n=1 Tax=Hippea jasoniae TaxID=944479 RepID=UPI00054CDC02|nr:hypothetical protein [Hippea jasoniae]